MLAFIGNLSPLEIVVIGVIAILVFGRKLPEVAGRFLYHVRRLRQSMYDLRRETGIEQEIRNVERTMRQAAWEAESRAAEVIEATSSDSENTKLESPQEEAPAQEAPNAPEAPKPEAAKAPKEGDGPDRPS